MTSIYAVFKNQQDSYLSQEQVAQAQQNLRASIGFLARELRMAGYDPEQSGNFSITDIRSRDLTNTLDATGHPAIIFDIDVDGDGALSAGETFSYSLYEYPVAPPTDSDGISDLSRDINDGNGRQLLGESIVAIGFAYSYFDGDGNVATDGGNVVWAIDSDNDNDLDLNIDTNKDGVIDTADNISGTALPGSDVNVADIAGVKIWLLAQTGQPARNFSETRTFVVANQRIAPGNNFRHRLAEMTVKCRNMGL